MNDDLYKTYCRGCGHPSDFEYCDRCSKTEKCRHGNVIADGCPMCDYEADMAYDENREDRR
jgi:hypothetical protein